jgi:hypothetical protein
MTDKLEMEARDADAHERLEIAGVELRHAPRRVQRLVVLLLAQERRRFLHHLLEHRARHGPQCVRIRKMDSNGCHSDIIT